MKGCQFAQNETTNKRCSQTESIATFCFPSNFRPWWSLSCVCRLPTLTMAAADCFSLLSRQRSATRTRCWATRRRGSSTINTEINRQRRAHPSPPATVAMDTTEASTGTLRPTFPPRNSSISSSEEDFQQVGVLGLAGFVTWKSHGILKWLFRGLEKSLNKMKSPKFWESHGNLRIYTFHIYIYYIYLYNIYIIHYIYLL